MLTLCLRLGYATPEQMVQGMDEDHLLDWLAYMLIQPIEPVRDDTRSGLIAALLANAAGHRNEEGSRLGPGDMLRTHLAAKEYRDAEPQRQLNMFAAATAKIRGLFAGKK